MKTQNTTPPRTCRIAATFFVAVLASALFIASTPARAAIIYSDDFSGNAAAALNGTAPDVRSGTDGGSASATWTAFVGTGGASAPYIRAAGNIVGVNTQSTFGNPAGEYIKASLAFVPESGKIYELKLDVDPVNAASTSGLQMGFTSVVSDIASYSYTTLAPYIFYRQNGSGVANAGGLTAFTTGSTFGTASGTSNPVQFTLTLDTTGAQWTASYTAFDLTTSSTVGSGSHTYTTNPTINGIFFSSYVTNGNVDNLQLQTIPEPSTVALIGVGLLALGWRARSRKARC